MTRRQTTASTQSLAALVSLQLFASGSSHAAQVTNDLARAPVFHPCEFAYGSRLFAPKYEAMYSVDVYFGVWE